jgi:CMP-N-acetylneuraminic acid synthetase
MFIEGADGIAGLYESGTISGDREHSQLVRQCLIPTGAAYAERTEALYAQSRVIVDPTAIHRMSAERSVDVDDPLDWVIAEAVGRHFGYRPFAAGDRARESA